MSTDRSVTAKPAVLLMTRPREASDRFVALLPDAVQSKLTVLHAPLLQINPKPVAIDLTDCQGVIFTSANGVTAAGPPPGKLPAYCVGRRTTAVAQAAGWLAQFCGATAEALVEHVSRQQPKGPLLHLHGEHTRGEIATRLSRVGLKCSGKTIYEQQLLPLDPSIRDGVGAQNIVIVPLFSPRLARHFASLVASMELDMENFILIALSDAVVDELKDLNCKDLQVSKAPDADAMAKMVRDAADGLAHLEGGRPAQ